MRMLQNGGGGGGFPARWNMAVKPCDTCKIAAALLFCRKDSLFLCMACDVKLHSHMRHERVWMCEVCEQAPASVTCRADAASLCVTCDTDIHSANPLARRHHRIPVVPFYDCAETVVKSAADILLDCSSGDGSNEFNSCITNECTINWGIPTDASNIDVKFPFDAPPVDIKSIDLFFPAADELLDFDFPILTDAKLQSQIHNPVNDSIVPVQTTKTEKDLAPAQFVDQLEIDFTRSNIHSYNCNSYPAPSLSHSVSSSSLEVGVVPEANLMLDISNSFMLPLTGVLELNGATDVTQQAKPLSGMDREARVLRYREKRKNRRFEKTIRYASRKAYAETRPRIKGRFAKRTELPELDVDGWFTAASGVSFNNSYGGEMEYGVVPSF